MRGLHFQNPPFAQAKLIQVTRGSIIDIILDIRKNSSTYGKYLKFKISSDSFKQLYIPEGFAHGFCTLIKNTEVFYKVSNYYSPENEQTIYFNDKEVGFSDNFIGLRIEDDKTEAITFLVDNEERLKLCLWNIPKKERMW